MKTTIHWLLGLLFLIGATARSATITSIVSYIDLADYGPPYPIQIVGSPAFGYGSPWYGYWGSIKVAGDPNEEIFNHSRPTGRHNIERKSGLVLS